MIKFRIFGFGNTSGTTEAGSPKAENTEPEEANGEAPSNPNGQRVLIVDDDRLFLKVTRTKLQSAGFQVRTAVDPSAAIAALGDEPADVILMDICFPPDVCSGGVASWDGFQLMTWLRGMPTAKGARFIFVSCRDSETSRQRARQLGAVAYFPKPLNFDALRATLDARN